MPKSTRGRTSGLVYYHRDDMVEYPPSLRITPAVVQQALTHTAFSCARCGQMLRGLPAPHCPECGHWTDPTPHIHHRLIGQHVLRLGRLGLVDRHLIIFRDKKISDVIRLTGDMTFSVVPRMTSRQRWVRSALALFAGGSALASLPLLDAPTPGTIVCTMGLILIAAYLIGQISVMDDLYRVTLTHPAGTLRLNEHELNEDDVRAFNERINTLINDADTDAHADPPDAPIADRCSRCGYPLGLAPPIATKQNRGCWIGIGVVMICSGVFMGTCCLNAMEYAIVPGALLVIGGLLLTIVAKARSYVVRQPRQGRSAQRCPACRVSLPAPQHPPIEPAQL